MKHDPLVPEGTKRRVIAPVKASGMLAIANDMANVLAKDCVAEWERILTAEGLAIEPMGT